MCGMLCTVLCCVVLYFVESLVNENKTGKGIFPATISLIDLYFL